MYKSLSRLALAAAALGVAAPAAGAHTVAAGDLTVTNEQAAAKTTFVSQSWPTDTTGFIFVDTDRDHDADVTLVVDRDGAGSTSTVVARRVSDSTATCQAFTGTEIAPTPVVPSADGGFRVDIPSSAVGADFDVMTVLGGWQPCGSTDGFGGAYTSWLGSLRFTDATAPGAPAGLRAVAADGAVSLDWADNPEKDLVGYKVYRRAGNGAFGLVATTVASQFADSGLTNGTEYTYYVKAVDERNASEESVRVTATPAAARVDPTPGTPSVPPTDPPPSGGTTPVTPPHKKLSKADGDPTKPPAKRPRVARITPKAVTLVLPKLKKGQKLVVYRRTPGVKWVAVTTTTKARVTDRGVRPGKRYEYRVVVVNKKGKPLSAGSKTLEVRVPKARKAHR